MEFNFAASKWGVLSSMRRCSADDDINSMRSDLMMFLILFTFDVV
jgi:hypothetical protein